MKQTIGNACGTIAVLHSLGNNTQTIQPGAPGRPADSQGTGARQSRAWGGGLEVGRAGWQWL